jgi:hypothetical protein
VKKWSDFVESAIGRIMFQRRLTSRGQEIRVLAGSICFRAVYNFEVADEKRDYDKVLEWLADKGAIEVEGWVDAEVFFLG